MNQRKIASIILSNAYAKCHLELESKQVVRNDVKKSHTWKKLWD